MKSEDFDICKFLDDRSIQYFYSGNNTSSGWISTNCIFCIDQSNHLGINLKSKSFSCFKCAEKGNAVKLIQTVDGVNVKEAFKVMEDYTNGFFVPREKHYQSKVQFPIGTSKDFSGKAIQFLEDRGYDPQTVIKEYGLYNTGPMGDYKHRIIIPVFHKKRIVSFVGRDITGQAATPYKNSSDQYSIKEVKNCLYNLDSVIRDRVVIVEGILDAWRIGDGAVATFGVKYTHEQLRLLKGIKQAFILYDGEPEAIRQAYKLAYDLSPIVPQIEVLELSEGDPDNMSDADVRALRKDLNL